MIKSIEDVIEFVKEHQSQQIEIHPVLETAVLCKIMKGNHRIWEDGTEYKVELPSLYRYIWKNRKAFNSMLKNECRFLVTKFEIGRKVSVYENITGHRYHGTISKITTQHLWIKVNDNCTLKFHWDDDICITRRLED